MNIDKYKIIVQDEFNLKLSVEVPKGRDVKTGKKPEEGAMSDKFLGYFSSLSGALKKITNEELNSQVDTMSLGEVLKAISELETRIESKYGTRGFNKLTVGDKL